MNKIKQKNQKNPKILILLKKTKIKKLIII